MAIMAVLPVIVLAGAGLAMVAMAFSLIIKSLEWAGLFGLLALATIIYWKLGV